MDFNTVSIEEVMYRYFVKYNNLNYLVPYAFAGSGANELNVYIDLYGLFHTLFSRQYRTTIKDPLAFTTAVVNMCAHYREYFRGSRVRTKFFIISSFNIPQENRNIIPEYNKTMISKLQNKSVMDVMELNLGLLELLCPYLPDIFFLKTEYESSVLMNYIMSVLEPNKYNLIITTDLYPIQLCAMNENTALLWPRKVFSEDTSTIVPPKSHPEAINTFWGVVEQKWGKSVSFELLYTVNPANLALLGALTKFPERDLKTLINISKGSKLISEIIGYSEMRLIPETMFDMSPTAASSSIDRELLAKRFSVLDIQGQYIRYQNSVESKTIHYENLEDVEAVQKINDKYFSNCPIDIFRL